MLPFEFTVPGPPLSHQTRDRHKLAGWRMTVRHAAVSAWPTGEPPLAEPGCLTIVYYHDRPRVRIDDDNLKKPIQDALNGLLFTDDNLMVACHTHKMPLDDKYRVRGMSRVLALAFVEDREFIYVRLEAAPNDGALP